MKIPFHRPNLPENYNTLFPESVLKGWLTTGGVVNEFEEWFIQNARSRLCCGSQFMHRRIIWHWQQLGLEK